MFDFPSPHTPNTFSKIENTFITRIKRSFKVSKVVVDSGTKSDVVPDVACLDEGSAYKCNTRVMVVGGGEIKSKTRGKLTLPGTSVNGKQNLTLNDVLVIPGGNCFLMSMSRMDRRGYKIVIENGVMNFFPKGSHTPSVTAILNDEDGLYHVLTDRVPTSSSYATNEEAYSTRSEKDNTGSAKLAARSYRSQPSDEAEVPDDTLFAVARFLKRQQKKYKNKIRIYDPFVASGRSAKVWKSQWFDVLHSSMLDFDDPKRPQPGVDYDFLITCPPFSKNREFINKLNFEPRAIVLLPCDTISRQMFTIYDSSFLFVK
jgi:hypothetical protein